VLAVNPLDVDGAITAASRIGLGVILYGVSTSKIVKRHIL
jgi:hypothetical protein